MKCFKCQKPLEENEAYEYRGAVACGAHFDEVTRSRDLERSEIMAEENSKLNALKGMDLDPRSAIGRANREILKPQMELAKKGNARIKKYEGR